MSVALGWKTDILGKLAFTFPPVLKLRDNRILKNLQGALATSPPTVTHIHGRATINGRKLMLALRRFSITISLNLFVQISKKFIMSRRDA